MDPNRFDDLAESVTSRPSRRTVVGLLGARVLGLTFLPVVEDGHTAAARRARRRHAANRRQPSGVQREKKKAPGGRCQTKTAAKCSTGACDVVDPAKYDPSLASLCGIKPAGVGKPVCCRPEGQACVFQCDCCGTMRCNDGVCGETCTAVEELCALGTNCCDPAGGCGQITQFKADGSICGTPNTQTKNVCCVLNNGAQCASSCQCCGDEVCRGGLCQEPVAPPPPECVAQGQACRLNGPACCGGVPCHENICQFPAPPCGGSVCF